MPMFRRASPPASWPWLCRIERMRCRACGEWELTETERLTCSACGSDQFDFHGRVTLRYRGYECWDSVAKIEPEAVLFMNSRKEMPS